MKAKIIGTGTYVPEKVLTNADFEKMVDTSDEWIVSRTGIRERRIAGDDEFSSTMGTEAAKDALKKAGVDASEIDLVLLATATPDHLFPCTAAIVQNAIGAVNAAAFDFQVACTGYIYGLAIAKAFIESGAYRNILLVAAEKLSSFVDYKDRSTCVLFGDGAGASVISCEGEGLEIEQVKLGADGKHAMIIAIPGGGARIPASKESIDAGEHYLKMEGPELFKHAVRRMTQSSQECIEEAGLTIDDISWMVPHQANLRMIESVGKRLGFPMEKTYLTVHKYGNTSGSTIPLALGEFMEEEKGKSGERILLTAFGAGLTWGSLILRVN